MEKTDLRNFTHFDISKNSILNLTARYCDRYFSDDELDSINKFTKYIILDKKYNNLMGGITCTLQKSY